jgi:hypothetical protein
MGDRNSLGLGELLAASRAESAMRRQQIEPQTNDVCDQSWWQSGAATPDAEGFVQFGDVSRYRLGQQCQYGSRYVDGSIPGCANLGEGLRFRGSTNDYHSLRIHIDDVDEFVSRVRRHRADPLS